jgi:glutathione S-transferase
MIELIQLSWSPYCIVQRRILEFAQTPFKLVNIPANDRSLVWRMTRQRYYGVPIIRDGRTVVFEMDNDTQVIAKYLDDKLHLGLFPRAWEGVQSILWRYCENEIESVGFKLNDIYYEEFVPAAERLAFLRHKERKFGRGCLDQWQTQQVQLLAELSRRLLPFEEMLIDKPYLLGTKPLFIDFDLYGMLANFLFTGHNELSAAHTSLRQWYKRMTKLTLAALG